MESEDFATTRALHDLGPEITGGVPPTGHPIRGHSGRGGRGRPRRRGRGYRGGHGRGGGVSHPRSFTTLILMPPPIKATCWKLANI